MSTSFSSWHSLKKNIKTTLFVSATVFYFGTVSSDKNSQKVLQRNILNKNIVEETKESRNDISNTLYSTNTMFNRFIAGDFTKSIIKKALSAYTLKCYALTKEQRADLMSKPTDVYVWGNGIPVDVSLDYSNFYPKKISNFSSPDSPQIIIVKFGEFHEAYLDKQGKIHICKKHRLPSMKVTGYDDCYRENMKLLEIPKRKIMDMTFTQTRLFALTDKNEVFVWKINYSLPEGVETHGDISNHDTEDFIVEMTVDAVQVQELKDIVEIASGTDHFLALDKHGDVWAMGDDTFGQWGQDANNRSEVPPFRERRYGKPVKVRLPWKVEKISSGFRHSFAINSSGELYGWGYNNQQQLSHSEEFATETSQKHVIFEPSKITREFDGRRVVNAAGGKDFSIFVTKDRKDIQEVWSTGNNLRGQLGINRISHLQDILRIDDVSGFIDSTKQKPLNIGFLACGRRHSLLAFDYGAFFVWGDNEKGQMGDRTRRMIESPFPKAKFELKHNVLNVEAGYDNSAVIVERLPEDIRDKDDEDEKRKKKKSKRHAKPIENMPKAVVKEEKPPGAIERIRNKVSSLWRKRQQEVEKMKAKREAMRQDREKSEEQMMFEEIKRESEQKDAFSKK